MASVKIDPRFNGPPDSGQGGYVCGMLAAALGAPCAEVTLRLPPPLRRDLSLVVEDASARLLDGEALIGEARSAELDLVPAPPVGEKRAAHAKLGFPFLDSHPFPTCFGCGHARAEGDGLRLFAGPLDRADGTWATSWRPGDSLADESGRLPAEIVWAALDCPSAFPVANPGSAPPIVLGRLTARIDGPVRPGEPYVVVSWPIELEGRKRHSGVALYRRDETIAALARALWIELRPGS